MGRTGDKAMTLILMAIVGIVLAMTEYALYQRNIILNALINSEVTLYGVMFFTVFFCELIGVLVAASE